MAKRTDVNPAGEAAGGRRSVSRDFAFPTGQMPSNLPAGSSQRLHQPLVLVLSLKFLLLAKSLQMEFSG